MTKGKGDGSRALRKAFQGKDHRERGQTVLRKRFGMLEKKQDYKVRAKAFQNKREKLRKLRLAASLRNPDEFHTGMINTQTDDHGRHIQVEKPKKGSQQKKENATNMRYLKHKSAVDAGAVKQLKQNVSFMSLPASNKHEIFIDEDEAQDFNAAKYFDTAPQLLDHTSNRPRLAALATEDFEEANVESVKHEAKQYHALAERLRRKTKLDNLASAVGEKQKLLQKGKRVLTPVDPSKPDGKKTYRWLYERKR
eukprot:TRINITY_DN37141_c0_g1_i1.p1 TRINITY_DN37141_c0_g1~~TRINITY_DN37141_c0_g1_i1.p1  ORF type:complete len:252 (+),score=120.24 TRINITY_DN37141_c0_g1_i1:133-888(+)